MSTESLRCTFCNKMQEDVRVLIAGPTAYICDECIDICLDIIGEARSGVDHDDAPATDEELEARARATIERLEHAAAAQVDPKVPAWHVRCSLCEIIVRTEKAIPIHGRGVLCRPCVVAIQATPLPTTES